MPSTGKPMSYQRVFSVVDLLKGEEQMLFFKKSYTELWNYHIGKEEYQDIVIRNLTNSNEKKKKRLLEIPKLEKLYNECQKQVEALRLETTARLNEEREKRMEREDHLTDALTDVTGLLAESNIEAVYLAERNRQLTEQIEKDRKESRARRDAVEKLCKQSEIDKQINKACCPHAQREFKYQKQIMTENLQLNKRLTKAKENLLRIRTERIIVERELTALKKDITDKEKTAKENISNTKDHAEKIQHLEKELARWRLHYFNMVEANQAAQAKLVKKDKDIQIAGVKSQVLLKLCKQLQVERKTYMDALKNASAKATQDQKCVPQVQPGQRKCPKKEIQAPPSDNIRIRLDPEHKQIALKEIRIHFMEVYKEMVVKIQEMMSDPRCNEVHAEFFATMSPQMIYGAKQKPDTPEPLVAVPHPGQETGIYDEEELNDDDDDDDDDEEDEEEGDEEENKEGEEEEEEEEEEEDEEEEEEDEEEVEEEEEEDKEEDDIENTSPDDDEETLSLGHEESEEENEIENEEIEKDTKRDIDEGKCAEINKKEAKD